MAARQSVTTGRGGLQAMEPLPLPVAAETADLLSSLPAHLLDEILRRLDLRDAMRTSALSRAWRRRWESVPGLTLSFPGDDPPDPPNAIGGVLLRYTAPRVSRFACYVSEDSLPHLDHWLIALSRRSVESIFLSLPLDDNEDLGVLLHSSIFSCARLVSLNLEWCSIPPFPVGFSGLPVLEELRFGYVTFLDHGERQLEAIIRGSPMLRVLSLEYVNNPVDCMIEAPNLHSLTVHSASRIIDPPVDDTHNYLIGELPCLQRADIDVRVAHENGHGPDSTGFLAGLARVLELSFHTTPGIMIDSIPFTFYNLRRLELFDPFYEMKHILLLFSLLRSSPNLEKLDIQMKMIFMTEIVADWEFLNAQWTDGMCANLQIVQIYSPPFIPVSFLKLILSKASLLRTLYVDKCPDSRDPLNELLTCRRASTQAQVLFKV